MRLSKNNYYSKIESKRENAKKSALEYISKVSSPSAESFRNLSKAESEISQYIDSPISVIYNNKNQNLYLLIQSLKDDLFNSISIKSNQYDKNIKNLIPSNDLITISVSDLENDIPISNIPLFSKINNGIDYCSTNDEGECSFYINKDFINKDLVQHMYIGVDQVNLYGNEYLENHYNTKVDINLLPVKVCLEVDEYVMLPPFGQAPSHPALYNPDTMDAETVVIVQNALVDLNDDSEGTEILNDLLNTDGMVVTNATTHLGTYGAAVSNVPGIQAYFS